MDKNSLVMCVSCPVAHIFLSEYREILNLISKKKKAIKIKEKEKFETKIKSSVKNLSNLLDINFDEMYYFIIKKSPLEMRTTSNNLAKMCCVNHIFSIISLFNKLLLGENYKTENVYSVLCSFSKENIELLSEIEKFLCKNKIKIESESLTKDEKNWSYKFLNSIGIIENDKQKCYIPKENLSDNEAEKAIDIIDKLTEIVERYVKNCNNKLKYEYCNEAYKDYSLLKDISINKFKNCQEELLIKKEPSKQEIVIEKINKILNNKTYMSKTIMCNYLKKANKYPKYILDCLMKKQRITDTHIATILFKDPKKKVEVQKWHKINGQPDKLPKQAKLHIKELAKILLVSEDVLSCGTGKIYGNWKIALDENTSKKFKDELLTSDDIKELEKIEIPQHKRPSVKTKEHIYDRIRTFINPNENDFEKMISENPEFFCEEDFCLFTHEEDGEEYYDYDLMYENLLHPEDFDTLLSVLEELQAQENN